MNEPAYITSPQLDRSWKFAAICAAISAITLGIGLYASFFFRANGLGLGTHSAQQPGLLTLIAALVAALTSRMPQKRINTILAWLIICACAAGIYCSVMGMQITPELGDHVWLPPMIENEVRFSRWIGSINILSQIYNHVVKDQLDAATFLKIAGSISIMACTMAIMKKKGGSTSTSLLFMTPIWWYFGLGHLEIYPVLCIGCTAAFFALEKNVSSKKDQVWPAILAGILPAMYIGFLPLSAIILLQIFIRRPNDSWIILLAAPAYLAVLWISSDFDLNIQAYLYELKQDLNLGEKNTVYEGYAGAAASEKLPFFSVKFLFSLTHLNHVFLQWFIGGGWPMPIILTISLALLANCRPNHIKSAPIFAALFYALYHFLMIPKLGPFADTDLFFMTYISCNWALGIAIENTGKNREKIEKIVISFGVGSLFSSWHFFITT